ncbi:hypothetical protein BO71DRAFT_10892 [Aspergillus ellipticus CBS 707.79]|uniref:Uncharacterized protein n=1 Tax=Aspergillus ellipticus CBS 707.79 TaxID=1448320 RepID=A0A319EPU2_9EURO|nr:hypothetical protein BO71DRAFT_10892 [Aspergillus ellipticus CBS 707.79]
MGRIPAQIPLPFQPRLAFFRQHFAVGRPCCYCGVTFFIHVLLCIVSCVAIRLWFLLFFSENEWNLADPAQPLRPRLLPTLYSVYSFHSTLHYTGPLALSHLQMATFRNTCHILPTCILMVNPVGIVEVSEGTILLMLEISVPSIIFRMHDDNIGQTVFTSIPCGGWPPCKTYQNILHDNNGDRQGMLGRQNPSSSLCRHP